MPPNSPNTGASREAQEWLTRAERDLRAARNELNADPPLPEMTAYHAQQAVEKALKAFLTARSIPFRYTHDLVALQSQCEAIDSAFDHFLPATQTLNPYATQFRYPGGPLTPLSARSNDLWPEFFSFQSNMQWMSGIDAAVPDRVMRRIEPVFGRSSPKTVQ